MRKSRAITLTVLAGLTLTGCCLTSLGCGRRGSRTTAGSAPQDEPPDHTWYDADGNPIPERWRTDERGNRVLDADGRPIPEPGVPYDRHHRPWVHSGGVWTPILIPLGHSSSYGSSSRSGSWLSGGSGYRSTSTTPAYRSGTGSGSTSLGPSSSSAPSSISRGGFGSTGSSSSSSS